MAGMGGLRVTPLTDKETTFHLVLFVLVWIFLLGILPWLFWKPTDSGLSIGIRVAMSILSTPIGYLFGWRWGFWPMGMIVRGKPEQAEQEPVLEHHESSAA